MLLDFSWFLVALLCCGVLMLLDFSWFLVALLCCGVLMLLDCWVACVIFVYIRGF
jgi:hypothetical protein